MLLLQSEADNISRDVYYAPSETSEICQKYARGEPDHDRLERPTTETAGQGGSHKQERERERDTETETETSLLHNGAETILTGLKELCEAIAAFTPPTSKVSCIPASQR